MVRDEIHFETVMKNLTLLTVFCTVVPATLIAQSVTMTLKTIDVSMFKTGECTLNQPTVTPDSEGNFSFAISASCNGGFTATGNVQGKLSTSASAHINPLNTEYVFDTPLSTSVSSNLAITASGISSKFNEMLYDSINTGNPTLQTCNGDGSGKGTALSQQASQSCTILGLFGAPGDATFYISVGFFMPSSLAGISDTGVSNRFDLYVTYSPVSASSDLSDQGLIPGDAPSCSIGGNVTSPTTAATSRASAHNPKPRDIVEAKHLVAIAGSSKPGTGAAHIVCTGSCTGNIDFVLTWQTFTGGDWLSITSPTGISATNTLRGTVTGTTPFELDFSADASTLSSVQSPYTAQFTITGNFSSKTLVRQVILDVLPPCAALKFVDKSIAPDPTRGVDPTEPVAAGVFYDFSSIGASQGQLSLRLYDSADSSKRVLLGTSDFIQVSKSDATPQRSLVIDPKNINIDKMLATVYLTATLIDPSRSDPVLAETVPMKIAVVPGLKPRIEVVQVTQDKNGIAPMITKRPTLVRIYPQQQFALSSPVAGVDTTISAVLLNPDGSTSPLSGSATKTNSTVTASETPDRNQINSSLNFTLPSEWADRAGAYTIQITAQLKPPADRPDNPKYAKGSGNTSFVSYWSADNPYKIGYFPLCWVTRDPLACPTGAISDPGPMLKSLYPFSVNPTVDPITHGVSSGSAFRYYQLPFVPPPWPDPLDTDERQVKLVNWVQHQMHGFKAPPDKIVAWLPIAVLAVAKIAKTDLVSGLSDPPYIGGAGRASWVVDRKNSTIAGKVLAHEIGHNLGLRHTGQDSGAGCSLSFDPFTDWKFPDNTIQDPGIKFSGSAAVIPNTYFDLMAYCPYQQTWIAAFHYFQLFAGLLGEYAMASGSPTADGLSQTTALPAATASDYLLITGSVMKDGSAGQLDPPYRIASEVAGEASNPNGTHCIRFSGTSGAMSDFCFTPSFTSGEGQPLIQDYFAWKIPFVSGTTGISFVQKNSSGDHILASSTSSGAPTITIQSPQPGDTLTGHPTLNWNASDPGGALLTYRVQISNDGDAWYPLSNDISSSQYTFDSSLLLGGSQTYLRVIAMNGVDSTMATVGPLTVNVNPQLSLAPGPVDFGNVTIGVGGTQTLGLSNTGTGMLPVTSVTSDNPAFIPPEGTFYVAPDLGGSVPITFQPATTGAQQATITVNGSAAVAVKGVAFDHPVPNIVVPGGSLDFATVQLGKTNDVALTISNTGTANLNIAKVSFGDSQFFGVTLVTPLTVAAGSTSQITLRFKPAHVGNVSSTLTISSDDPTHGSVQVALSGIGQAPPGPFIIVSPASLTFGSITVGQTQDLTLNVTNAGQSALTVSALNVTGSFSVVSPAAPFTVASNASTSVTVRFAPKTSGSQTGSLAVVSNDPTNLTLNVALAGIGAASSGSSDVQLLVDGGSFNYELGYPQGLPHVYFVNRLTPPKYPATLKSVQIYFGNRTDGLAANAAIKIVTAGNSSGSTVINGLTLNTAAAAVGTLGTFSSYSVAPLTITSGDFIVGFVVDNPANIYPADEDTTSAAQGRSYYSADGVSFGLLDLASGVAGNLAIRATVTIASSGSPQISVSPASLSFGGVTVGQSKSQTVTIKNTGNASLNITSATVDNKQFSVPALPASIAAGATASLSVQFTPTSSGAQSGTLTLASNDPANPTVKVSLTGTGAAAATDVVLKVDGGTFTNSIGFSQDTQTGVFVNRLTPPSYPATLKYVQIYFGNRNTGLPAGAPITILEATNPSGSVSLSAATAGALNLIPASVGSLGTFNTYTVPSITITSGDFVVGFLTASPAGVFPADEDQASASQGRSYISSDGLTFFLIDALSPQIAGNFGIRATVTLGAQ